MTHFPNKLIYRFAGIMPARAVQICYMLPGFREQILRSTLVPVDRDSCSEAALLGARTAGEGEVPETPVTDRLSHFKGTLQRWVADF